MDAKASQLYSLFKDYCFSLDPLEVVENPGLIKKVEAVEKQLLFNKEWSPSHLQNLINNLFNHLTETERAKKKLKNLEDKINNFFRLEEFPGQQNLIKRNVSEQYERAAHLEHGFRIV